MMIKYLRPRRLCRVISFKLMGGNNGSTTGNISKLGSDKSSSCGSSSSGSSNSINGSEIKWELRPGGMLVQKRESGDSLGELITIRVSTVSNWHDISIEATSTFGELKMILSIITSLEPREQRILFKGKEREDSEYLHMVGVRDKDKVLLLEDPAIKEMKKNLHTNQQHNTTATPIITV